MTPQAPSSERSPQDLRCDNCGRLLASPDAVCAPCEAVLNADRVPAGPHVCPACQGSFGRPLFRLVPERARWYVPQRQAFACPHCQVMLRDQRQLRLTRGEAVMLIVAALGARWLWPPAQFRLALFALVLVFLGLMLRRRVWRLPTRDRYALAATPEAR